MSKDDTNASEKETSFFNRWSARKRETTSDTQHIKTEEAPELDSATNLNALNTELNSEPASAAALATADDAKSDEQSLESNQTATELEQQEPPLLTDADMPPFETLTAKSDLSDFFNKGVSATLRRAALRHVFSLPIYNVRDGLNDYDDDYTKFEPLGDTVTSDMKWHKARKEREALEAEEERKRLAEEAQAENEIENEAQEEAEELDAQEETEGTRELADDEAPTDADTDAEPESLEIDEESDKDSDNSPKAIAKTQQPETTA